MARRPARSCGRECGPAWWIALSVVCALAGCDRGVAHTPEVPSSPERGAAPDAEAPERRAEHASGDVQRAATRDAIVRGAALAVRFECTRCHAHAELAGPPDDANCAGCHAQVARGTLDVGADEATQALWRAHVRSYLNVPSLTYLGARLRRSAIAEMVQAPHDVRPHLAETMPRLAVSAAEAADLAAWLAPEAEAPARALPHDAATLAHGRQLVEELGCGTCHERCGEHIPARPLRVAIDAESLTRGIALAPDLAEVPTRLRRDRLVQWLLAPRTIDPETTMPALPRSRAEAEAIAAYLSYAPIVPRAQPAAPVRLPLLGRRVTFAEVEERVFRRSCWHCHSEPDFNEGDGGPGNTGGFGFAGRGLSLASASAVRSGARDDAGLRRSILRSAPGETARLVEVLLARQREEAGDVRALRGMPLGLPALSAEDIQLVESWIAGGAGE